MSNLEKVLVPEPAFDKMPVGKSFKNGPAPLYRYKLKKKKKTDPDQWCLVGHEKFPQGALIQKVGHRDIFPPGHILRINGFVADKDGNSIPMVTKVSGTGKEGMILEYPKGFNLEKRAVGVHITVSGFEFVIARFTNKKIFLRLTDETDDRLRDKKQTGFEKDGSLVVRRKPDDAGFDNGDQGGWQQPSPLDDGPLDRDPGQGKS